MKFLKINKIVYFRSNHDDEDDFKSHFEEELAGMDVDEPYERVEVLGSGPENQNTCAKWGRPALPSINADIDEIVFQQIEIDNYNGNPLIGMPGAQIAPVPIMRMYGVTMEGNSVCCHVHGFAPYMYVTAPKTFERTHLMDFKSALDKSVMKDMRSNKENVQEAILSVEIVEKQSIYCYSGKDLVRFVKITVVLPKMLAAVKRLLDKEVIMPAHAFQVSLIYLFVYFN